MLGERYLSDQLWFNVGGDLARLSQWVEQAGEGEDGFAGRVRGLEEGLRARLSEPRGVIDRLQEMKVTLPPLPPINTPTTTTI